MDIIKRRQYELTNHLGNVLATIKDEKKQISANGTTVDYYEPIILTATDYYPFGMPMPNRQYSLSSTKYRYSFNGKEHDDEIYGEGNAISFEFRTFDARLGRMFSPDPRETNYPWQSTYAYYGNSPIATLDFLGLGDYYDKDGNHLGKDNLKDDNKAYLSSKEARTPNFDKNGKETGTFSFKNPTELSVSNSTLNKFANTVANESGYNLSNNPDYKETYGIASCIMNLSNLNYGGDLLKTISDKAQICGSSSDGTYQNNAEQSMAGAINALTGGKDYSNGAIRWDGSDFFSKWTSHDKPTYQGVNISLAHLNVMQKTYPNSKVTAGLHLATAGLLKNTCWYSSTAAHGGTIFWGKYLKTETTFRPFGSFQVNENGQPYEWKVPAYKVKGFINNW